VSLQRASDGKYWDGTSFSSTTEVLLDATGTTNWSYAFPSSAFPGDGSYTLRAKATDKAGNASLVASATFTVNVPPKVSAGGPYTGNEGSAVQLTGTVSSDATSMSWSYSAGPDVDTGATCTFGSPSSASTTFTCTDDGTYTVTLTASDGTNPPASNSTTVKLSNVAPVVVINSPLNGATMSHSIPVNLTSSYTDAGKNDSHTCQINWGDGAITNGTISETAGSGSGKCTGSHAYSAAGSFTITVTVTDDDLGPGSAQIAIRLL